jgi:elongation factor G
MRCFTVLGPSHSGKTTLVRALSEIEGRPQISELNDFYSVRSFRYIGDDWAAIDIAGGPDYLGYAGEALAASDGAVLCVPPDPEAAPLAAPYLRLIEESGVPASLFINRMDVAEARVRDIIAALQTYANHVITLRQVPIREGDKIIGSIDLISERAWEYKEGQPSGLIEMPDPMKDREQEARTELLEHLADFDDGLLEQLIEDQVPAAEEVYSLMADVHQRNEVIPAFLGAAINSNGVNRLMKSLRHESPDAAAVAERIGASGASAIGVFAENKKHLGKTVLLRALDGSVGQGATLGGDGVGNLTEIGGGAVSGTLTPGALALAAKSDHLDPGAAYSGSDRYDLPDWTRGHPPAFKRVLMPKSDRDDARLSGALARLSAIDPGLAISQDEETGHAVVHLQGPMHLRRVLTRMAEDFGVETEDHPVAGSYRETISRQVDQHHRHRKQSGGAGQFADVHLVVKPLARGAGFTFDEVVKGGAVPRNYIPSVEAGAIEALKTGPLGFKVIDVAVTLTDGKSHSVDSSDYAFQTAGKNGVKEALQAAGPVLLQPIHRVDIHVPSVYTGGLVAEISSLKGQVLGFDPHPIAKGWDIFRALLPAASEDSLLQALGGLTQGTAWIESSFDHYEEVRGKEAERITQSKDAAMA